MGRGRVVPEAQAAAVVRKLALALVEANAQGVIHRDLKPGNIMVRRRRDRDGPAGRCEFSPQDLGGDAVLDRQGERGLPAARPLSRWS